ncbi:MAG: flagellar basal body P-ring formation chaperone FlgA [Chromatiales bacterium]
MMNYRKYLVAALLCLLGLPTAQAQDVQSHASILKAAEDFARQIAFEKSGSDKIAIESGKLDHRLRLAQCDQPLTTFESPNTRPSGSTTIGVRCDGNTPWKLYVPVTIQVLKNIVVLKQPVSRNAILRKADLHLLEKDISDLYRGYYTRIDQLAGKHAKRAMKSGTVITPSQVKNPLAVKRGSVVTILADLNGIQVRMKGKALKSGSAGDWIKVRNLSSDRTIEGQILSAGVIQVAL